MASKSSGRPTGQRDTPSWTSKVKFTAMKSLKYKSGFYIKEGKCNTTSLLKINCAVCIGLGIKCQLSFFLLKLLALCHTPKFFDD